MKRLPRRMGPDEQAQLVDHLGELRTRIAVAGGAVLLAMGLAYSMHARIIRWLEQPLPPDHRRLVTFGVTEPFTTSMRVSFMVGLVIASPVVLWQLWSFMAPALPRGGARALAWLVPVAALLAVAGVTFGYVIALPAAAHFLTNYDNSVFDVQVRASDYLGFATTVLFAVALVFELPVFIVGLVRLSILSSARLRRSRRIGYFAVACVAVALPGVDPVTTTFEMIPLLVLYEASIWVSVLLEPRWRAGSAPAPTPS